MTLLQVQIDEKLKKAIQKKSKQYGVSASSLVRIVLVKAFLPIPNPASIPGNVFNADRDNDGDGIPIDDLIDLL